MKLTHKKTENHHVNLKAAAILIFFSKSYFSFMAKPARRLSLSLQPSVEHGSGLPDMYDVEIDDGIIVPVSHFHIILARSGSKKRRYTGS